MSRNKGFKQLLKSQLHNDNPECFRCDSSDHALRYCTTIKEEAWKKGSAATDLIKQAKETDQTVESLEDAAENYWKTIKPETAMTAEEREKKAASKAQKFGGAAAASSPAQQAGKLTIRKAAPGKSGVPSTAGKCGTSVDPGNNDGENEHLQRKTVNTPGLGTVETSKYQTPPAPFEQKISLNDVYPKQIDSLDPPGGHNQGAVKIVTNYLRVTDLPDSLYVYSLDFWRPGQAEGQRLPFKKRREIKSAFAAVTNAPAGKIDLSGKVWASDYKDLYCTTPLPGGTEYGPFEWSPPGKARIRDLRVTLGAGQSLSGIPEAFRSLPAHELSDQARALNAFIARAIQNRATADNTVTHVSANKFYLDRGWQKIKHSELLVRRGYFTSVRPGAKGPVVNVNTATSAFLPHMNVEAFFRTLDGYSDTVNQNYIERLLRGCTVRIRYTRQGYEGLDMNSEENRLKTFQQFGFAANKQMFWEVIDERDANGKHTGKKTTKKSSQLVVDYYKKLLKDHRDVVGEVLCVNVGKKVSTNSRRDNPLETDEQFMRRQVIDGAIWIPANLLDIVENQQIKVPLRGDHQSAMINLACRRPTKNVALIDLEGLRFLGRTPNHSEMELVSACQQTKAWTHHSANLCFPGIRTD